MRQFFAILFVVIMVSVSSKDVLQWVMFRLNQDYISAVFCINKNRPEMNCDGKCYLSRTLDKSNKESSPTTLPPPNEKSILVYYQEVSNMYGLTYHSKANTCFHYLEPVSSWCIHTIPHPPEDFM
jgi:hypothetical protein